MKLDFLLLTLSCFIVFTFTDQTFLDECPTNTYYQCADSIKCIRKAYLCNKVKDCPAGDDETDCDRKLCRGDYFPCKDEVSCIARKLICDGISDCPDNSDEVDSLCLHATTNSTCPGFVCDNKQCLSRAEMVCDGFSDCADGSDEKHCIRRCDLTNDEYLCQSGDECISLSKVCDNKIDCSDKSDEGGACHTANVCESLQCDVDQCVVLPSGPTCMCKAGYVYDVARKACADINECDQHGFCSQGCVNTAGSYICTCAPKFRLKSDNKTCEANYNKTLLVYSTQKHIKTIELNSRETTIIAATRQSVGVAYDGSDFYWTDVSWGKESIVKLSNGSKNEVVLTAGLEQPEDLAIDWLTGNIYFTDAMRDHIAVCTGNGSFCTQLVHLAAMDKPRGIVLHPTESLMFWTDWGNNSHIGVAFMDGTQPKVLIDDVQWPNGITLDWPNDRIYWVDAKTGTIESIKITGKNRHLVLHKKNHHPYGIAVFEDRLYWSDWESKSIESCNKYTGKESETITDGEIIYGVHIYHDAMKSHQRHACSANNCSHICLLSSHFSYTCACPDNMKLLPDLHTCRVSEKQFDIILAIGQTIVSIPQQTFGRHANTFAKSVSFDIDCIEFNSQNGEVFIADNKAGKIMTLNLQTGQIHDLVTKHVSSVDSMGYDYLANNLYWVDNVKGTIEVFSLNSKVRVIIQHYTDVNKPTALVLTPSTGEIFVALKDENHYHIDRLSMNGVSRHQHVVETGLNRYGPIHLAVDEEHKMLYWSDAYANKIEFSDFNGMSRKVFLAPKRTPGPMAIVNNELYWTSFKSMILQWNQKSGKGNVKLVTLEKPPGLTSLPNFNKIITGTPLKTQKHLCMNSNGGCSDICISDGESSRTCLCETGRVFKDHQNLTCVHRLNCDFRCSSGECLDLSQKCDGKVDCADKSDESNCRSVKCDVSQFMCRDVKQCISVSQRCDMNYNCDDHSDEENCNVGNENNRFCRMNQIKCPSGLCIDVTQMCDGFDDCGDGFDEICEQWKCSKDFFQCISGQCIPKEFECNIEIDCKDGSDEHADCKFQSCKPNMKACPGGWCINEKLFCDGHEDCDDAYDEIGCTGRNNQVGNVTCDLDEFQCLNSLECISSSQVCNGEADCPKGEDERGCPICLPRWFECANHNCVSSTWVCDGHNDCGDFTDESNCTSVKETGVSRMCAHNEFKCNDGLCLPYSKVCDGRKDCSASDDEAGACVTSCNHSPCDQKCIKTPKGAICDCFEGYQMTSAGDKRCVDIDECKDHNPCSQDCTNTIGSFRCSCYDSFILASDKITCKAFGDPQNLLFTLNDEVRQLTILPHALDVLIRTKENPIADIAVDVAQQKLLLMAQLSDELIEYNLKSGEKKIFEGVPVGTRLAYDWISGNTYIVHYPDDARVEIHICNFKSKKCARIIKLNYHDQISAIAVDPINRIIFYVQLQNLVFMMPTSIIVKARLDGSDPKVIANESHVTTLALDIDKRKVYFTDLLKLSLNVVDYNGDNKKVFVEQSQMLRKPAAMSLFENHAYIIKHLNPLMTRCKLYGNMECNQIDMRANNMKRVVVVQQSTQRFGINHCADHGCDELCVPADLSYRCLSSNGAFVGRTRSHGEKVNERQNWDEVWWWISLSLVALLITIAVAIFICRRRKSRATYNSRYEKKNESCIVFEDDK